MWHLTLHRWIGDRHAAIDEKLDEHLAWMRTQQLDGTVLAGGPSSDGDLGIIVFGHSSRDEVDESLQAHLVMVSKAALNRRYDAIRYHSKPWRVADSPTRHRPQISVRSGLINERSPRLQPRASSRRRICKPPILRA